MALAMALAMAPVMVGAVVVVQEEEEVVVVVLCAHRK